MWGSLVSLRALGACDPGSNPGIPRSNLKKFKNKLNNNLNNENKKS